MYIRKETFLVNKNVASVSVDGSSTLLESVELGVDQVNPELLYAFWGGGATKIVVQYKDRHVVYSLV